MGESNEGVIIWVRRVAIPGIEERVDIEGGSVVRMERGVVRVGEATPPMIGSVRPNPYEFCL